MSQDRRFDDVLGVVLVGARDIAGEREARQRGDRHVGRAADPEFVHAPAPDRHLASRHRSCTRLASRRPPSRLTLMLITRHAPRSRAFRASSAEWMLSSRQMGVLSTDWSRVVDDVVVGQGLLDQEQVEIVEGPERRQIVKRVGRVGVDLERGSRDAARGPAAPRRHPSPARS